MSGNANNIAVPRSKKSSRPSPPAVQVEFGQRLKALRGGFGLRQRDVADRIAKIIAKGEIPDAKGLGGVNQGMVSDWETAKVLPEAPYQHALAELFGVSTEQLLGRTPSSVTGVDVLPEQLKSVVGSDEWLDLPSAVRQAIRQMMEEVDLPAYEVQHLMGMLRRGSEAYRARRGQK